MPRILAQFDAEPLRHLAVAVHLDLLDGLESNEAAVRWLAGFPRCAGIITVRHRLVPAIRKQKMLSIIRLFLHDGRSVKRGVSDVAAGQARRSRSSAGHAPPLSRTEELAALRVPFIAGGLVKDLEALQAVLKSDCKAVSTSKEKLWRLNDL